LPLKSIGEPPTLISLILRLDRAAGSTMIRPVPRTMGIGTTRTFAMFASFTTTVAPEMSGATPRGGGHALSRKCK
jgi:hypothetical protein